MLYEVLFLEEYLDLDCGPVVREEWGGVGVVSDARIASTVTTASWYYSHLTTKIFDTTHSTM